MKWLLVLLVGLSWRSAFCADERYVSLTPATTEILFALGLEEKIVGVTTFCNYPPEAKKKPKVGTFSDPNIEQILFLKPSLVFTTGLEQAPSIIRLRNAGLKVMVSDPKTIAEFFASLRAIAAVTGTQEKAEALVCALELRLKEVKRKVKEKAQEQRPSVFIEIWHDPIMTAGRGSFVDEVIRLTGARNIACDVPRSYSRFSSEEIIARNPDIIILCYMIRSDTAQEFLTRRLGWGQIKAVKNKRIIDDIDPDLLLRPGPRIIDGLEMLYRKVYHAES